MGKVTVSEHAISAQHSFHHAAAAHHKTAMAAEKADSPAHAFHKGMAATHEECASKLAECMKALGVADLEKSRQLLPSPNVTVDRPTIKPIPRAGGPAPALLPRAVDPEFSKILGTNPEDLDERDISVQ